VTRISDSIDLGRLALRPGEGRRFELDVRPGAFSYGGERYAPAREGVPARLDVSRTATGHALRLRFEVQIQGPCVRCLEEASQSIAVDARELDQPSAETEEFESPYVAREVLDLAGWAHDALALAMPERFLCREDCAGLCFVCGASLNDADAEQHRHEPEPDPRWAKLRELKLE
jgi:uncharacterized protein